MDHTDRSISAYTASDALTDALVAAGVTHVFINSGTDYPPIVESWAKYESTGKKSRRSSSAPTSTLRSAPLRASRS